MLDLLSGPDRPNSKNEPEEQQAGSVAEIAHDLILARHRKRKRRLKNISVKLDAAQIIALRKIATLRSIPYQTLIRQWLSGGIAKELHLALGK